MERPSVTNLQYHLISPAISRCRGLGCDDINIALSGDEGRRTTPTPSIQILRHHNTTGLSSCNQKQIFISVLVEIPLCLRYESVDVNQYQACIRNTNTNGSGWLRKMERKYDGRICDGTSIATTHYYKNLALLWKIVQSNKC